MGERDPLNLDELLEQASTGMQDRTLRCCCGKAQCTFLAHNSAALAGLEKDLVSAAQIGQALLLRHETHMAESEAERLRMNASIEELETRRCALEMDNAKKIEENRMLLDQLEDLNQQVVDSDSQIQSLTASLQATQRQLQRLTALTQRASSAEAQLLALEAEYLQLQTELATNEDDQRTALQRWRRAEITISQLQSQINHIEREAKEERERHIEVVTRMERTRAVENELEGAAGRLKDAPAVTTLGRHHNDTSVVSHFVRDILQDNANLQSGVMELRELLMGSNAEVEGLREQLQMHRPVGDHDDPTITLNNELNDFQIMNNPHPSTDITNSALHVHHHYHAPSTTVRKPKKKRPSITITNVPGSSSGTISSRASRIKDWRANTNSALETILSQTSASVPFPNHQHRWSTQSANTLSSFATSSGPSSPRHTGSIFDTIESTLESSLPTTPGSTPPASPSSKPQHIASNKFAVRGLSGSSRMQIDFPSNAGDIAVAVSKLDHDTSKISQTIHRSEQFPSSQVRAVKSPFGTETIPEEGETQGGDDQIPFFLNGIDIRPPLRRATSHESLLSVSGMDIHTLRERPSQLLLGGPFSPTKPYVNSMASSLSSRAAMSHEIATARPMLNGYDLTSGEHARSLLHSMKVGTENRPTLTQKLGGWVWGSWNHSPVTSPRAPVSLRPTDRPFGINQKGPIPGLVPPNKPSSQVESLQVNDELLKLSLGEILATAEMRD